MFEILLDVMAPVFLIGLLGYVWARRGMPFETGQITALVTLVGAPCLVLDTLSTVQLDKGSLLTMGAVAVVNHLLFLVLGWLAVRLSGQSLRTFLPGVSFGNTGNIGLPLCLFAFGDAGLALAIAYFTPASILMFILGPQISSGRMAPGQILRTPVVWAVLVAAVLLTFGLQLPRWLSRPVHLLGGLTVPVMLMALGVSLSRLRVSSLGRSFYFSLVRIGGGMAVGLATASLFGLQGAARGVAVVEAAMPVAVFNYLFAASSGENAQEVASMVIVSTCLSMATLPLILWFVQG